MTDPRQVVNTSLQALRRATAQEIAKAAGLPLAQTYESLVALEACELARVEVTHDRVGVGYYREWVAA